MAEQRDLDGSRGGWFGQLTTAFGERLADNLTGAERQPDTNNPSTQQGQPTPSEQMAGRAQAIMGNRTTLLLVGGTVLVVAVVAIMGARK